MHKTLEIAAVLALSITLKATAANGDNNKAATVICKILKLAATASKTEPDYSIPQADVDYIEGLNMSLAHPSWSSQFPSDSKKGETDAKGCDKNDKEQACKKQWVKWQNSRFNFKEDNARPDKLPISEDKLRSYQGQAAAMKLAMLASKAQAISETQTTQTSGQEIPTMAQVIADLQSAAFGEPKTDLTEANRCKVEGGSSRASCCTLGQNLKALCQALVCLCGKDGASGNSNSHCNLGSNAQFNAFGANNIATHYAEANTKCMHVTITALSSHAIRSLAAELKALETAFADVGSDKVVIGKAIATTFCGAGVAAACIDLTAASAAAGSENTPIPWETHLHAAAEKLQKIEEKKQRTAAARQEIKVLKAQADAIYRHIAYATVQQTQTEPTSATKAVSTPEAAKQKLECQGLTKATQCREKGHCKWNSTDKTDGNYCELNEANVAQQQTTKTGKDGATSGADPNCKQHGDKTSCEKRNTAGQSPVCGWRKGKDNEPDLEKEMCRNGGFLVNERLALMAADFYSFI
uniref:Variant surface glycoprotein 1005 n=1 Tax=Trypanosoma brucei TaxID=5691 RepID=M4TAK0_9TRYP|nr:variant surface glycoprotein 1005 [Trypanosoma brucei]